MQREISDDPRYQAVSEEERLKLFEEQVQALQVRIVMLWGARRGVEGWEGRRQCSGRRGASCSRSRCRRWW